MDNLDLAHLDPGHVLEYFLQSTHASSTGTKTRQDPSNHCTCYEPPHVNGVITSKHFERSNDGHGRNVSIKYQKPKRENVHRVYGKTL